MKKLLLYQSQSISFNKWDLKMKLTVLLFFSTILMGFSNESFSQKGITLHVENATVARVIDEIEATTPFNFVYNTRDVDLDRKVTVHVKSAKIREVLDKLFSETRTRYKIRNDQIILVDHQRTVQRLPRLDPTKILNLMVRPENPVQGSVRDSEGNPLIGVNIRVKGSGMGTTTDLDGHFELDVTPGDTLVFSYIGFRSIEMAVEGQERIDVILFESVQELEELIVVGYGVQRKRDLTGSVSSVKGSDVSLEAAPSIESALRGKVAGLTLRQNSAQPGGGFDILVRGAGSVNAGNEPLYIVDGFPIAQLDQPGSGNERLDAGTQGILNFVNPNDIESVEVLKDASATAIYGSRAANGVVLITTKRGTAGKAKVAYSTTYAIQKHTDIYDVFSLKEWMDEKNKSSWDYWLWENEVYPYGLRDLKDAINAPRNGVHFQLPYTDEQIENAPVEGTNWVDLVTRDGKIQQHNLSVQGGSDQTRFMASLNFYQHDGIIRNSEMNRYSAKINVDQKISEKFDAGINLIATRLNNSNVPLGEEEFEKSGIIRAAIQMGPHIAAQDENGNYPINPLLPTQPNPFSLLTVKDNGLMDRILTNAFLTVTPVDPLQIKFNVGLDRAYQSRKTFMPRTTLHGELANGLATINESNNEQYLVEVTSNYNKNLGSGHQFSALAGYSYELFKNTGLSTGNNGFLSDAFLWNNLNAGEGTKVVGSWGYENERVSFFGRVNYTLLDRYLFTGTIRADGASVFSRNNKWGFFPSLAAGWVLSDEEFMAFANPIVSFLKFRVGIGQTGNSDIGSNAFASYYASPAWNSGDNGIEVGVFPGRLENPDLKWETTTELNLGLDYELYKGRISGALEYYNRIISDLLNFKELNAYHSISSVMANIGKTRSRGFELTLNTRNVAGNRFSWNSHFTFALYRDTWLERTEDWKPAVYEGVTDPIRSRYSRIALGILQEGDPVPESQPELKPGQLIIADINGYKRDEDGNPVVENGRFILTGSPDGIIDDADTRLMGTVDPGYTLGLSNSLYYRNFDLSFHFYGMFDRYMQDPTRMAYGLSADGIAQYSYNALRSIQGRWKPNNASTTQPSSFYGWSRYGSGDWFLEKAWFVRLQNITLGYTLPATAATSRVFQSLRLKLDVNNVLTFTPYGGLDPETDSYTAAYPNARTFTIGIDVKF